MSKRKSILSAVISAVLALLVLALVVGIIFNVTGVRDKLADTFDTTFRVEFAGKKYTGNDNFVYLPSSGMAKFTVKAANGYKVKVEPYLPPDTELTYTVNGQTHLYSKANISYIFVDAENVFKDCFYVDCNQSLMVTDVLSRFWGGAEITLNGSFPYYYLLTVTNGSNGEVVTFLLCYKLDIVFTDTNILF